MYMCTWTPGYLEVPEEEGEDEPDADAHHPGHQHERQQPEVRERLENNFYSNK